MKRKINEFVDEAIQKEFISIDQLEGKNILLRNVIRELVAKVLQLDEEYLPFKILMLEKDVSQKFVFNSNWNVKFFGIIDRVDEKDNVLRIVDYKTGKVEKKKPVDISIYFEDVSYKEQFQAMYYAYLTSKLNPGRTISSGLLALKSMKDGVWMLNSGDPFSSNQFQEFEVNLKNLLLKIFDKDIPFRQTDDEERCTYCAYKEMCHRGK